MRPGPFHIGNGDPAPLAARDRRDDPRIDQRLQVTLSLEPGLDMVDAAGDIDGEDEFEIDVFGERRRRQARCRQQAGKDGQAAAGAPHRYRNSTSPFRLAYIAAT